MLLRRTEATLKKEYEKLLILFDALQCEFIDMKSRETSDILIDNKIKELERIGYRIELIIWALHMSG